MAPSSDSMTLDAPAQGSRDTQRAVEQFLYRQADILDDRKWEEWLALFTDDAHYWMPVSAEQTIADGVPNIFYEDLNLMRVRIKRVTHPHAWSQQPGHRTSHVVSNVVIEDEQQDSGDIVVRSRFHVAEYWNDGLRHFAGRYRHELTNTADGYRVRLQRVDLVNAEGPFDYVIQTWL